MLQVIIGVVAGVLLERALHIYDKIKPLVVALLTKVKPMLMALLAKAKAKAVAIIASIKAKIAAKMVKKSS